MNRKTVILLLALFAFTLTGGAKPEIHNDTVWVDVPFALAVPQEDILNWLQAVPPITLSASRDGSIEYITERLRHYKQVTNPEEGKRVAARIFDEHVLPLLTPRIEKFNEVLRSTAEGDKVPVGFLLFPGLASSISKNVESTTSGTTVQATLQYLGTKRAEGEWNHIAFLSFGNASLSRTLNMEIDETIMISLEDFADLGVDAERPLELGINMTGLLDIEVEYNTRLEKSLPNGTELTVRFRPYLEVKVERRISGMKPFFESDGDNSWRERHEVPHPAVFEVVLQSKGEDEAAER